MLIILVRLLSSLRIFRDLGIRVLLILLATITFRVVSENVNYDLHLVIRKPQPTSPQVVILEVDSLHQFVVLSQQRNLSSANKYIVPINHRQTFSPSLPIVTYSSNVNEDADLSLRLESDSDGQFRRFAIRDTEIGRTLFPPQYFAEDILMNFRGPNLTFERLDLFALDSNLTNLIANKWVVIHDKSKKATLVTPLGVMDKSEIVATLLDNVIENRAIAKVTFFQEIILILVILFIHLGLLVYLPASLALVSTFILYLCYLSLSLFMFDQIYVWTPILNPFLQMVVTYILIANYKDRLNENTKWKLARNARYQKELEEMKNNFLSLFSHDLKTPIAKVIGLSETLIANPSINQQGIDDLKRIHTYARHLERYLHRILKISQLQSDKVSLQLRSGDINGIIESCLKKTEPLAAEKEITLSSDLKPLFLFHFDHQLLEEVIYNFLENAIKYSPAKTTVLVATEEIDDFVKVRVIDHGPGVPAALQDAIWEKFYRLESKRDGYGLGLYLCKYFIELHGGRVYLKSGDGHGSEFGFMIPIKGGTE